MPDRTERQGATVFARRAPTTGGTVARHIARIGAVFDAAPIGVAVWSVSGELLHANPVMCDLLQRGRHDLVGEPFDLFIDAAEAPGIRRMVDELWDGERNSFECDLRCKRPDGSDWWLHTHVTAVYGPGGRPEYFISQVFDFATRRSGDERARRLSAESPVMLWLSDELGIPRTGNAGALEFLGIPASTGELRNALFETVHPEDYERHRERLQRAIQERTPFVFTARSRRADGQWRWVQHRGRPIVSSTGVFEGFAGASIDVTDDAVERQGLEEIRRLFDTVTEAGPLAVVRTDAMGRIVYANGRFGDLLDEPDAQFKGLGWRNVLLPEYVDEIQRRGVEAVERREGFVMRVRAYDASIPADREGLEGRYWAELRVAPVFAPDGVHEGFVATIADISNEVAAGERADRLARVLDEGSDFLLLVGRNGAVSYVNSAAEEVLGVRASAGGGEPHFLMEVLDAEAFEFFHTVIEPVLVGVGRWKGELNLRGVDGRAIPTSALFLAHRTEGGRIESISVVARDISEIKADRTRMEALATHDSLTGLANRVLLYDRLDQALRRHQRHGHPVALLYLDLDEFKPVNDERGHHVGDKVLQALADRIHGITRETDTPARIGGDEFAILIESFDSEEFLERIAERLVRALSEPVEIDGTTIRVGVSIGIVAADKTTNHADALIARADAAMYVAKATGRGRFVFDRTEQPDEPDEPAE